MILDGRDRFYQWDLDRKLIVTDESIDEVHFCNRTDDCSLVCEVYQEGELRLVDVPNILLQKDWRINVYAFDGSYTKVHEVYEVERRTKPADYIYTETEIKNYDDLAARVAQIEENGISDEAVESAVERYLDEHDIKVDLDGYATEPYVDEKIEQIELTPGPAGKDGSPGKDGKDGQDYVLTDEDKREIADMVEVSGGGDIDLTGYATEDYVDSKAKQTVVQYCAERQYVDHTSMQNYKSEVQTPGPQGPEGPAGKDGEDYVLTEADKQEIADMVDVPGGGGSGDGVEEVYVGAEAPDDANIKIWVDTDEEANYPNREEIQNEVFTDAMHDMLNNSTGTDTSAYIGLTSTNKHMFAKNIDTADITNPNSSVLAIAIDCRSDKETAIRRLKQGYIIKNTSGGYGASSQYTLTPAEVGCSGFTYLYDTTGKDSYGSTHEITSAGEIIFINGGTLFACASGSEYRAIPYFNRIIFNNRGTGLASTDMQAAIVELSTKSVEIDGKTITKTVTGALQTALPYLSGTNPSVSLLYEDNIAAEGGYYSIDTNGYCNYGMLPRANVINYDGQTIYVETTISGVTVGSLMKVMSGYSSFLQAVDTTQPVQYVSGTRYTFNKTFAPGELQCIRVYSANPTMEDYTKIPSDCVVLTSPNGTMYQLSVADDGTLTTKLFS